MLPSRRDPSSPAASARLHPTRTDRKLHSVVVSLRACWVRWGTPLLLVLALAGWITALQLSFQQTQQPPPQHGQEQRTTLLLLDGTQRSNGLAALPHTASPADAGSSASLRSSNAAAAQLGRACCRRWDDLESSCAAVCSDAAAAAAAAAAAGGRLLSSSSVVCVKGPQRALVDWIDLTLRALFEAHCSATGGESCNVRDETHPGLLQVHWVAPAAAPRTLTISSIGVAEAPRCASAALPDLSSATVLLLDDPRQEAWEELARGPEQIATRAAEPEARWLELVAKATRRTQRVFDSLSAATASDGGAAGAATLLLLGSRLIETDPQGTAALLAKVFGLLQLQATLPQLPSSVEQQHQQRSLWRTSVGSVAVAQATSQIRSAGRAVARAVLPSEDRSDGAEQAPLLAPMSAPIRVRIAFVSVADAASQERYAGHFATVRCYAMRHGHSHVVLSGDEWLTDSSGYSHPAYRYFFFKKHASVSAFAHAHRSEFDWFVVLDGDVFVSNSSTPFERYLRTDPVRFDRERDEGDEAALHVIHYERAHNGEVMAGNYAVRSRSAFALDYLRAWAANDQRVPHNGGNWDNGALHHHILLRAVLPIPQGQPDLRAAAKRCEDKWLHNRPHSEECAKCVAFEAMDTPVPRRRRQQRRRTTGEDESAEPDGNLDSISQLGFGFGVWDPRVSLHRRGGSFARDFFISHPGGPENDVFGNQGALVQGDPMPMIHGWKEPLSHYFKHAERANAQACRTPAATATPAGALSTAAAAAAAAAAAVPGLSDADPYQLEWHPARIIPLSTGQAHVRSRDDLVAFGRGGTAARSIVLGVADMADCWPTCPPLKSREQMDKIRQVCESFVT